MGKRSPTCGEQGLLFAAGPGVSALGPLVAEPALWVCGPQELRCAGAEAAARGLRGPEAGGIFPNQG